MDHNNFYLSYPDPAYQQVQQPWLVHDNLTLQEGRLDLLVFHTQAFYWLLDIVGLLFIIWLFVFFLRIYTSVSAGEHGPG